MAMGGEGAAGWLLRMPQDRLVAIGRLCLAAVSLLAIYLDPLQPARSQAVAYGLLIAYVLFAALVLARSFRDPPRGRAYLLVHVLDVALIGTLMVLTEGPTSPFFVFFSFILLSATLRWDWWGAFATGAVLTLLYAAMTFVHAGAMPGGEDADVNRIVVRAFYLLVATVLFAYFGAYRARTRGRLARLAAWPASIDAAGAEVLRGALAHAAGVLGVPRILAIWEEADEPFVGFAESGVDYREERLPPDRYPGLAESLQEPRVIAIAANASAVEPGLGGFVREHGASPGVTAPFVTDHFRGRIFLVDSELTGPSELALAAVVAFRVGAELEHHRVRAEMRRRSATEERMRLARQLHDGMLQSVTAARLQIVLASGQVEGEVKRRIEQVSELLGDEQRQIRAFVDGLNPSRDDG